MDFDIPKELADYLLELDDFIEREIKPLENSNDNIRFFDHRREDSRTDWHRGGLPNEEWEQLLGQARKLADKAGHYRYALACTTTCRTSTPSSATTWASCSCCCTARKSRRRNGWTTC